MADRVPTFEYSTSPLRSSNDGQIEKETSFKDSEIAIYNIISSETGEAILTTEKEVVASAFIAGYDYATKEL